jgi:heat shock protein HslJ
MLNDVSRYRILGNQLQLIAGEQALAFSVAPTEETDGATPPPGTDLSPLDGTTWYLMSYYNQTPLPGTGITAQFAVDAGGATGTIGGSAGCNAYSAAIGAGFAIGPAAGTGQLCTSPPGVMDQEQAYLAALPSVTGFSLTNGQLLLTTTDGLLVYSATPPQPPLDQADQLQNRTWYLVTYNGVGAVAGVEATVRFESTGALSGNTGCNAFNGSYRTDGPRLSTEALSATSAACAAPLGDQDTAMLATLDTASSYQINATQLQIFASSGTLTFSATAPVAGGSLTPVIVLPASGSVGQVITFDGTQSSHSRPIIKYVWFFGDGAQSFGPTVQHAFGEPGTYVVELQIADDRGETATTTQQIQITAATPFVAPD